MRPRACGDGSPRRRASPGLASASLVALFIALSTLSAGRSPRAALVAGVLQTRSSPSVRLEPPDDAVRQLPAPLIAQLREDAYVYFRFINAEWMKAMCGRLADVLTGLPNVRLHGDPHLEQYAFTTDSRGLDDFDDSTTGPFVLDVTRFLASLDLALDSRGWGDVRPRAINAFLAGYGASSNDATYLPPDPEVVTRLRGQGPHNAHEFLAWADSLMLPLGPEYESAMPWVQAALEEHAEQVRRGIPAAFVRVKKTGRLNLGVGSALTSKVLLRLEGPSSSDDDDIIVEAKRAGDLTGVPCLAVLAPGAVRVVSGSEQIGRLRHQIMMVVPRDPARGADAARWWLRSWDPSYREVNIADYVTGDEIVEVAHDVGAQLGRGHVGDPGGGVQMENRDAERRRLDQIESRVRQAVAEQTAELIEAWQRFRAR
jgi:Uncharacterized protein conserved in bacteria (DUF2252)